MSDYIGTRDARFKKYCDLRDPTDKCLYHSSTAEAEQQRQELVAGWCRDDILAQVEQSAGLPFAERAAGFVTQFLASRPEGAHGETITDACKAAGITPADDRAFGPVYMRLARRGVIKKIGQAPRRKGNLTAGGNIWAIAA